MDCIPASIPSTFGQGARTQKYYLFDGEQAFVVALRRWRRGLSRRGHGQRQGHQRGGECRQVLKLCGAAWGEVKRLILMMNPPFV